MDFEFYEVPIGHIMERFGTGFEEEENLNGQQEDNYRQFPGASPLGPPKSVPPMQAPAKPKGPGFGPAPSAVDTGAIRRCLYRFVYIWLRNGRAFWMYLTFVGRNSIAGWRWNGRRWVYFGLDTDRIEYFICS
ncbi:hypothetical protein [Caloramator sp. E03]|uniref:hypothetical protein n=1 Tax=Caloramator sp. E03 TaxID=2576307 RepID=UPI001A9BD3B8|nr:hypothetical protein [Caloramator sp. E03]